jgi:hypothetical protein
VLQVRLGTGQDMVRLTSMRIDFAAPIGQAGLVQGLRVQLLHDTNMNGHLDAEETILATGESPGVGASFRLDLTPALHIPPASTAHLVVLMDISSTTGGFARHAATSSLSRYAAVANRQWLAVLFPGLGLVCLILQRRLRRGRVLGMGILLLCSMALTSYHLLADHGSSKDNDTFAFTVAIPTQGIAAQGETSGPLTAPAVSIIGASVSGTR